MERDQMVKVVELVEDWEEVKVEVEEVDNFIFILCV
jgi:hypothetical protein